MLLKKEIKYPDGTIQTGFYISKCKYCSKNYIKVQNRTMYCSDKCRQYSRKEQKESYNRKYRLKYNNKSDTYWGLGSGYLGEHRHADFEKEISAINMERKRLKLKSID